MEPGYHSRYPAPWKLSLLPKRTDRNYIIFLNHHFFRGQTAVKLLGGGKGIGAQDFTYNDRSCTTYTHVFCWSFLWANNVPVMSLHLFSDRPVWPSFWVSKTITGGSWRVVIIPILHVICWECKSLAARMDVAKVVQFQPQDACWMISGQDCGVTKYFPRSIERLKPKGCLSHLFGVLSKLTLLIIGTTACMLACKRRKSCHEPCNEWNAYFGLFGCRFERRESSIIFPSKSICYHLWTSKERYELVTQPKNPWKKTFILWYFSGHRTFRVKKIDTRGVWRSCLFSSWCWWWLGAIWRWIFSGLPGSIVYTTPFSRWWQLKYFWNFHPETWRRLPIWLIFFKWVESTN